MAYPWGDERRFNSYAGYFRRLFGDRVQKLSVDAGFTCPNRDGTVGRGGCTFCINGAFTPSYCTPAKSITQQIDEGIEFHRNRYRTARHYLVYFQSYSNTYAPLERLKAVYGEALRHPDVVGIVVGTRPDCVDEKTLDYLAGVARDRYVAVEYGIESTRDATLRAVNRGHDFAAAERAVRMTAGRRNTIAVHLMNHRGAFDAMPRFPLSRGTEKPETGREQDCWFLRSGDLEARVTAGKNWRIEYRFRGRLLTSTGSIFNDPENTGGYYTMPNMTTPESVNCYAAALDFLASRYCRTDNQYGRINYWIMHNEVDMGLDWTNMGAKSIWLYTDTYMKSMRMCYNIARQYDPNAEVLGSFTHHWAQSSGANHPSKDMLEMIVKYSKLEGDFKWGVAHHPYPDDLSEPKTWLDKNATFSMSSPKVTFKNLEVINKWILESENLYMGTTKRTLWLSENGTNSPTYSEEDLNEQAAGFAYAWKKIKALDGIDGIQWHNWIDNRSEYGLRIGLRRYPDDEEDPLGKKHVWYAYQAAGTDQEDTVFEPYLAIIGISDWDIVQDFISE